MNPLAALAALAALQGNPAFGQFGAPGMIVSPGGGVPLAPMQLPRAVVRIGEQAIWSTQQYADAAALANMESVLFTTPINQTGQGFGGPLSLAETNVREASRIPGGFAYTVKALAIQPYYPASASALARADVSNTIAHCVLVWAFLQTRIEIAPAWLVGSGGGVFGGTADTGAAEGGGGSRILVNNGNGQVWIYGDHPVALPANATFNLNLAWGSAASAVDGGVANSALNERVVMLGTFESAIPIG